jgi:hypothetical protein
MDRLVDDDDPLSARLGRLGDVDEEVGLVGGQ